MNTYKCRCIYIYIYTRHWPKTPPAVLLSGFYWRHCLSGFVETRGSTFRPCAWYSRAGLRWVRVDFSPDEHRFLAYLLHEIIYIFPGSAVADNRILGACNISGSAVADNRVLGKFGFTIFGFCALCLTG